MKGFQAGAISNTSIGPAEAKTSVQQIVQDTNNTGSLSQAGYTDFYFNGAGFSTQGQGTSIKVSVNIAGVNTAEQMADAINAAIDSTGKGSTQEATAFANAQIKATVVTDSNGQHLAFTSSEAAFQVRSGDRMSAALMGSFVDATSNAEGKLIGSTAAGAAVGVANATTLTITGSSINGGTGIDLAAIAGTAEVPPIGPVTLMRLSRAAMNSRLWTSMLS